MNRTGFILLAFLLAVVLLASCNQTPSASENISSPRIESPAYDPSTATSTITGSIKFDGTPPVMAPIKPGGSRFCVVNARGITEQDVLVTKDKKLQNVVVYVRSGWQGKTYVAPVDPVILDQQRCVYVPHVVTIGIGQKLKVLNSDNTFHNVHARSSVNTPLNLAQPEKGSENIFSFDHAEPPFRIGCDLHSWMGVWVAVFEHPFHSKTDDSGKYELKLPPGKYEIAAWHEKLGEKVKQMEVSANEKAQLDFNFSANDGKSGN